MAVYVDNVRIKWQGNRWCHLVADTLEELHDFARRLGLKRCWFQDMASYPHYDVTIATREKALALGAIDGNRLMIITCARAMKAQMQLEKDTATQEQLSLFSTT